MNGRLHRSVPAQPFAQAETASGNACSIAKTQFAMEMVILPKISGFHNWQQFHDQRYRAQQRRLDDDSGLSKIQLARVPEWMKAYFSAESDFPCYRFTAFDRITMPTLVMVGKYDMAIGVDQMKALADSLPNARFDEFENSEHFVYAEEPNKFVQDIYGFIKKGIKNHSTSGVSARSPHQ